MPRPKPAATADRAASVTAGLYPDDLEHVPTAADLLKMGLARSVQGGYWIGAEGHALMGEVMARNAAKMRVYDEVARSRKNSGPQAPSPTSLT